jgi:hypothetical protein
MPLHAPETARVAPTPVTQKTNRCFSSMGVRISERPLSVLLCLFIDLKKKEGLGYHSSIPLQSNQNAYKKTRAN